MPAGQNLISVAEAADQLGITRRAVIHRIHAGTLAATKIGAGRTSQYVIARTEVQRAKTADQAA